jgi:hypothetical protein
MREAPATESSPETVSTKLVAHLLPFVGRRKGPPVFVHAISVESRRD